MTAPQVVLDCDPGHDDAVAIALAGRHTDLLGITTVDGNAPLADTTRNALVTAQLLDLDVPVHAGADRPLLFRPSHQRGMHGDTGLDGPVLPPLRRSAAAGHAVEFIIEAGRSHPGLWLVAVGPLTNVALAFRLAPDLVDLVGGVSVMGGSAGVGNSTPVAEFNSWSDPEAADIVLSSGCRVLLTGLHLTHQVRADPARLGRLRSVGTAAATFVADLLDFYGARYASLADDPRGAPLHDPCALLALTHPHLFEVVDRAVTVELSGSTRGMTVVDQRAFASPGAFPVGVVMDADADGVFSVLAETLAAYP